MHALLDAEFGTAAESFAQKKLFGYDRRLRGGGANRGKRHSDPPPPAPAPGTNGASAAVKPVTPPSAS